MIVPIDDIYRISTDEKNWVIQKRKVTYVSVDFGKETVREYGKWHSEAYFPSIKMAVNELARRMILAGQTEGLPDAIAHVKNVCNRLTAALEPEFNVTRKSNERLQ